MSDAMAMDFADLGQVGKASLGSNMAGAITGGVMDIANFVQNSIYAKKDRDFRDMVYRETKEREDNAVQRRIADMAKAGISPLASVNGAGASAGGSSASAPMVNAYGVNPFSGVFGETAQANLNMGKSEEQSIMNFRLLQSQSNFQKQLSVESAQMDTELKNLTNQQLQATIDKTKLILERELFSDVGFQDKYQKSISAYFDAFDLDNKLKEADTWAQYIKIGFQFLEWALTTYATGGKGGKGNPIGFRINY